MNLIQGLLLFVFATVSLLIGKVLFKIVNKR